jgi:citrate lyase beta subunit
VIRLDDRMIDAPVVARARRVLAIAERLVSRT